MIIFSCSDPFVWVVNTGEKAIGGAHLVSFVTWPEARREAFSNVILNAKRNEVTQLLDYPRFNKLAAELKLVQVAEKTENAKRKSERGGTLFLLQSR